tara:strand:+ start:249 stop:476 length:228 start_codon:yes stop_codon:yes gene_type:complete
MNKNQIKRFAKYLVFKTKGQFHYEEDYWKDFVSKSMISKIQKKLNICMRDKNYEYFCDMLFKAFDQLYDKNRKGA